MTTYTIEVTDEDIRRGHAGIEDACPIALAVERVMGDTPTIDRYTIEIGYKSFVLPPEASQFVEDFDMKLSVHPFAFVIDDQDWDEVEDEDREEDEGKNHAK